MGINSIATAYNYGQLGSAITDSTAVAVNAPKGGVIVAITSLDSATAFTTSAAGLVSEVQTGRLAAPEFINTVASANDNGDTTSTASTSGSSTTLTIGAANADISVGMIIESMGDTDILRQMIMENLQKPAVQEQAMKNVVGQMGRGVSDKDQAMADLMKFKMA